jgi:hypothetical protein
MSLNDRTDLLYEKGRGTLRVQLERDDPDHWSVHIMGNRSVFVWLAGCVGNVLEGIDCKFGVAPFAAGCGWFGRTMEEKHGSYYMTGRVLTQSEGGLYIHCQPCPSGSEIFSGGRGLAWMCFSNELSESGQTGLDYDPAYLVLEGRAEELLRLKDLLMQSANGEPLVLADQVTLQDIFSESANLGVSLMFSLRG